jgi:hypothetical protein
VNDGHVSINIVPYHLDVNLFTHGNSGKEIKKIWGDREICGTQLT